MEGATPQITPQSGQNRDRIQETEKKGISQNPVKGGIVLDLSCLVDEENDPYGTRTRVTAVKGRCPRPLDEGAAACFDSGRSITVDRVLPNFKAMRQGCRRRLKALSSGMTDLSK